MSKIVLLFFICALYTNVIHITSGSSYDDLTIWYYIWVGNDVSERYKIKVHVPNGSNFYDVMVKAADEDDDFRFESKYIAPYGNLIVKIGDNPAVGDLKRYWWYFSLDKAPKKNNPPGEDQLVPVYVNNLKVQDRKHYLFWLITNANFSHAG